MGSLRFFVVGENSMTGTDSIDAREKSVNTYRAMPMWRNAI